MVKARRDPPSKTKNAVLKEFNDRCAMCGAIRPQIHHIDSQPDNNAIENLIPLCPNCHLTDQHNPTGFPDPGKLRLFRIYKDPTILHEKFVPLWSRCKFLLELDQPQGMADIRTKVAELIEFVAHLQMGGFYSRRLNELIQTPPSIPSGRREHLPSQVVRDSDNADLLIYRQTVAGNIDRAVGLVVELLRYQDWKSTTTTS